MFDLKLFLSLITIEIAAVAGFIILYLDLTAKCGWQFDIQVAALIQTIKYVSYADLRGCVAGNRREGLVTLKAVLIKADASRTIL